MKLFSVKVQNPDGSVEEIEVSAETTQSALDSVSMQGKLPLDATEKPVSASFSLTAGWGSVPTNELYHFTRLFSTLSKAGIPILETLELLAQKAESSKLRSVLSQITDDVRSGTGLINSFNKHQGVFDKTYLQLIEVGEESGNLPQVLSRLTDLLKKRIHLRRMIIKSLSYPVFVLLLSFVVVTAILVLIVPRFKDIYSRFGGDLPGITRFTLACSDLLISYFPWVFLLVFAFLALLAVAKRTETGRGIYDRISLSLPLMGTLFHTYEIAGFAKSFSILVHSGITVTSGLELIGASIDRIPIRDSIKAANDLIRNGQSMAESFDLQRPWLPELLNRMVAVGEKSGNLPEMLEHVAEFYEEEFNNSVETVASLIEPVLIVFLGLIIGTIVISLYLPIFGMAQLISRR